MHLGASYVALATAFSLGPQRYADEAWDWVNDVQSAGWERIAPVRQDELSEIATADDEEWVALISATDGWGDHWQMMLRKPWRGAVSGSYVYVNELRRQLVEMWEPNGAFSVSADAAVTRLSFRSGTFSAQACESVEDLASDLELVKLAIVPERVLILHTPTYRVRILASGRKDREIVVIEKENALAMWCAQPTETVLNCENAR